MGLKKVKIAIIGGGYMADEHLKVLSKFKNVSLVGIYNRTRSNAIKLKKKYKIREHYSNIEKMYYETKADGVIVAISPDVLKNLIKKIFIFPWKCLIEKPIGIDYNENKYIYNQAKKYKSKSFIALNRRFYSSTQNLIENIKKNKKKIIVINDQQNIFKLKKRFSKKILDNFMYVNSIHLLDYVSIICRGKISKIQNYMKWRKNTKQIIISKIFFSSGDIAYYNAIWNMPAPWSITVYQDKNTFLLKPLENFYILKNNSLKFKELKNKDNDDKIFKPGLKKQSKEFIKAILKKKNNLPTLDNSLKVSKLINLIYKV